MSQLLWCESCGIEMKKEEGSRRVWEGEELYPGGPKESDEYERIVWGRAKRPTEQRYMLVNCQPFPMPTDHYICDQCGRAITPGSFCLGQTIWKAARVEPSPWEDDFLERAPHDSPKQ